MKYKKYLLKLAARQKQFDALKVKMQQLILDLDLKRNNYDYRRI